MNRIEGNMIIARFMKQCGLESVVEPNMGIVINEAKYHKSWDWLMPVVEKIESYCCLGIDKVYIQINDKSCSIWTYFDVREFLRMTGDDRNENGKFKVK